MKAKYATMAAIVLALVVGLAVGRLFFPDRKHELYEPGVIVVDLRGELLAQSDVTALAAGRGLHASTMLKGRFAVVEGMTVGSEAQEVAAFREAGFDAYRPHIAHLFQDPLPQTAYFPFIARMSGWDFSSRQWGTALIQADKARDVATGRGVTLGISDGGYALCDEWRVLDQPETAWGYDFHEDDDLPCAPGHGTHTASTALAPDEGLGIIGVAPEAKLMQLRVCGDYFCSTLDGARALEHAAEHGARIVSMSWGSIFPDAHLHYACDCYAGRLPECAEYDLLLIASRGNYGSPHEMYPASFSSVVAVSAIGEDRTIAPWSSYGDDVELCAPGVLVHAAVGKTGPDDYQYWNGTSMAAPHVAGTAALVMEKFPSWTSEEVLVQLRRSACDLGDEGRDRYYGHGHVDAWRALHAGALPPCLEGPIDWVKPTPTPEPPG